MLEVTNTHNNTTHGQLCGTISEAIDAVERLTGAVFCELWEVYGTPEASGEPTIIYTGYRADHNQPTSVAHLVPADTDDLLYGYPYWEPVIYYDTPPEEPIFGYRTPTERTQENLEAFIAHINTTTDNTVTLTVISEDTYYL